MTWIMRSTGEVQNLAEHRRLAWLLALIAEELAGGNAIAGHSDLVGVLTALDDDQVLRDQLLALLRVQATELLDGLAPAGILDELLQLVRSPQMRARLPDLRLLTCRWEQFGSRACNGIEPRIRWYGLDRIAAPAAAAAAGALASPLGLTLAAGGDRELLFEPVSADMLPADLGDALRARLPRALCLTLSGTVTAEVGLGIPLRLGTAALASQGRAAARLTFYVDPDSDRSVARSFAASFAALTNPFDLDQLANAFSQHRLRAVRIEAGGELGLHGSLGIGLRDRLFAGVIADVAGLEARLAATLRFHTARRGEYLVSLYPAATHCREVRADIHRLHAAARGVGLDVGLTLDLTPVLAAVRDDLLAHAGAAADLLGRVQDCIPPSRALQAALADWLGSHATAAQQSLLGERLGTSAEVPATQRLVQRLCEAFDRQGDVWQGEAVGLAVRTVDAVLIRLGLAPATVQALGSLAREAVAAAITQTRADLRAEVRSQLADGQTAARLRHALDAAGERVGTSLADADALTERIGSQLDRLQVVIARLTAVLRESAESRLAARWRIEETRTRGSSIEQSLLFRPGVPGAAALFQRALTGSLEELFDRLAGQAADDVSQPVSLLDGRLQDFAGVRHESGLELTLLDFDLEGSNILEAGVTIETDAAGNISVRSESRSRHKRSRLGAYDEFEVVNAFALAAARATGRMSLSLALSHVDKDLQPDEARRFFAGFVEPAVALLTRGQVDAAITAMPDAHERRRGELRAWLELDGDHLLRLLRLDAGARFGSARLPRAAQQEIYETAIDALMVGFEVSGDPAKRRGLRQHIWSNLRRRDVETVLKETFDGRHLQDLKPEDMTTDLVGKARYDTVTDLVHRARALVDGIELMREVYLARGDWTVQDYLQRQERIGGKLGGWLKGEFGAQGFGGLLSSKAGPYALAFFKAIAALADAGAAGRPLLFASIVVEHDGHEHSIPLIAGASDVTPSTPTAPPPTPAGLLRLGGSPGEAGAMAAASATPRAAPTTGASTADDDATTAAGPPARPLPTGSASMAKHTFIYPLDDKQGTRTYHSNERRFNAGRANGRRHAGCDLLAPKGTPIRAMADGTIRQKPYAFYSGTYALEVVHDGPSDALKRQPMIVRYGEILQRLPAGLSTGKRVQQGDVIAYVGQLNSGSSMLHLELYARGAQHGTLTGTNRFRRRADVTDPTAYLDAAPTWSEFQAGRLDDQAAAKAAVLGPVPQAAEPDDSIDPAKVSGALNCRAEPRVDPTTPPLYTLRPGERCHVLRLVPGGRHPYGGGNEWAEISYPGRRNGYVIAHFVKLKDPQRLKPPAGAPPPKGTRAVVSIDGDTLNLRQAASMQSAVITKLNRGERVTIADDIDYIAATDMPTRNRWLKVVTSAAGEGFVAAHYLDMALGDEPENLDARTDPELLDPWIKILTETDWPGCGPRTARQIGEATGGREVSRRMAEEDLARVIEMASVFQDAAARIGVPAALLAGIASRETRCGGYLPGGWSDNRADFGIMQINKHAHPDLDTSDPRGVRHVEHAANILAKFLNQISAPGSRWQREGWEPRYLLQGAVAAYNFGLDDVRNKDRIDVGSTNDDYGNDTLTRARYFYENRRLKPFFQ